MAAQDLEIKFDPGESFIVTFFRPEVTQKIPELPHATPQVTPHVLSETEMRMLRFCEKAKPRSAIIDFIQMNPDYIRKEVIPRLIVEEFLSLTIPHKPRSPYQKYVLTEAGRKCLEKPGNKRPSCSPTQKLSPRDKTPTPAIGAAYNLKTPWNKYNPVGWVEQSDTHQYLPINGEFQNPRSVSVKTVW